MIWDYLYRPLINELNIIPFDFGCKGEIEPWNYVNRPSKFYEQYFERFVKEQASENGRDDTFYEIVYDYIKEEYPGEADT